LRVAKGRDQKLPRRQKRPEGSATRFPLPATPVQAGTALLLAALACVPYATPGYRGPKSDHFDGKRFQNYEPFPEQRVADVLRWQLNRRRGHWPDRSFAPRAAPPERVGLGKLRVTFVNHATVLVQMDGLNFLTDPVWSTRVGPKAGLGVRRHQPPGIRFEDLPPIDVVLLSHNHYDHLDVPTLRRLARTHHPRILTFLGNRAYLKAEGIDGAEDYDWWQQADVQGPITGMRVIFVPARHWSGRSLTDHRRTLWGGFVIEGPSGSVYFAGDTGYGEFLKFIRAHLENHAPPPFRLALLPVAPFEPRWYMARKHLSPGDAVRAARLLGARTTIAIHWGTFELGDDDEREARDSVERYAADTINGGPRIWALENGEGREIP
jgi:L-ascorbate metabolism protein UlaG (beta-lactamase superfamily)